MKNSVTVDDIRREHDAAIASLTIEQRHAVRREVRARKMTAFRGGWWRDHLDQLFTEEAALYHLNSDDA